MTRKAVLLLLFVVAGLFLPMRSLSACTTPFAPSWLSATQVRGYFCGLRAPACNAISLHWQDNSSDETAFDVYVSTNGGVSFYLKGTVGANVVSFVDNDPWCLADGGGCRTIGPPPPVTAFYYVVSRNACGTSVPSNVVSAYWPSN
jgi:hypothetical protein